MARSAASSARFGGLRRRGGSAPRERLSYSQKCVRLTERLRDPEWRRYGLLLIAGKFAGLAILMTVILFGPKLLDIGGRLLGGSPAFGDPATMPAMPAMPAAAAAAVTPAP